MSAASADVLELLLPEADPERQARVRKAITFLRLLASSASPRRATSVRLALAGARSELESATRERLGQALRDLIAHHLAAALPPDSFLDVGTPQLAHDSAWALLAEDHGDVEGQPHVPSPGEQPLDVAARLIACARRVGLEPDEVAVWCARLKRLRGDAVAGERAFRALIGPTPPQPRARLARAALAGAVECLLDRGAVLRAVELLAEQGELVGSCERLTRLDRWARLLAGDEQDARRGSEQPPEIPPRLPAQLVALRRSRSDWLPRLAGVPARGRSPRVERVERRSDLGAAVLAVFSLGPAGAARAIHVDCAPALSSALSGWLDGRDGACRRAGELEREMAARAEAVLAHAHEGQAPRGAIDAGSIRAVALAPVVDRDGELRGWLRLECEHHLLPSPVRLRALARAWRADVRPQPATLELEVPVDLGTEEPSAGCGDPRVDVLREMLDSVGAKTAQRRWWALVSEAGAPRPKVVAEGGGALELWREHRGGGRALRRALVAAGSVRFDEPEPILSLAADSSSGLVVPIVHREQTLGLVVVESSRRRDVAAVQPALEREAEARALALRVACFRAWHLRRWGHDLWFDVRVPPTAALAEDLLAAAAAAGPVTLSGPAGSGKQVLARWLHGEGGREAGPLVVHACGARDAMAEERELFGKRGESAGLLERARGGTLVLDDVERLTPAVQARLERWLAEAAAGPSRPRIVLTTRSTLALALEGGRLRGDLARRLQRLELFVPALAARREEIADMVRMLGQRFASELRRSPPEFSDEALGLLWRQPWAGNVRELENVVYKLVLRGDACIETAHLEDVARRFRFELLRRIKPREADPDLIAAALRSTRNRRGTPNKTRAALYLGWDPDTLARRLREADLDAATLLG